MKCYVSGRTGAVQLYEFGGNVSLPLDQEVFAKFVLRAGEDKQHQAIMNDLRELDADLRAKQEDARRAVTDYSEGFKVDGDVAQLQLVFREADYAMMGRLLDKTRSGLRILEEIRKEYED